MLLYQDILNLLKDELVLEDLSNRIYEMQYEQSYTLISLKSQLENVEKKLNNIVQALENGIFSNATKQRLDELENQKEELEKQIFEEQSNNPFLTKDQILYKIGKINNYKKADKWQNWEKYLQNCIDLLRPANKQVYYKFCLRKLAPNVELFANEKNPDLYNVKILENEQLKFL